MEPTLDEVVVEEALLAQQAQQDAPVFVPRRVHRRSMTLAAEQVFEAMGTGTQAQLPEAYNTLYANWMQTSAVELAADDAPSRAWPLRTWVRWGCRAGMACVMVGAVGAAVALAVRGVGDGAWRWPAWAATTLAAWALDSLIFHLAAVGVETAFATSQHVIYYMQGAKRPAERLMAAVASLAAFCGLFAPFSRVGSVQTLKALVCVAVACAGLAIAQVGTKVIAAHFHRKGFFARLQAALREEYYIMALSKPRGARMRRKSWTEQAYAGAGLARRGTASRLGEAQLRETDPSLLTKLEAVERHVRKNRLKLVFDRCTDVKDEATAKQLAFYIFWNVMGDRTGEHLTREDLARFLPAAEVDGAFAMLDPDGDGRPTWEECRQAVTAVFARRQLVADSLNDTNSIIGVVNVVAVGLIQTVLFFVYLLVWQVDVVRVWLTFSSIALAFTFVFGSSLKTAYENVVFLLSIHPYDVGDRLKIDDDVYVVHKMKLSTTILEQDSGVRVWYPNSRMALLPVYNMTRAQVVRESFAYAMDLSTGAVVFDSVHRDATAYVTANQREFCGGCTCATTATMDPLKLRLTLSVTYSFNAAQTGRLSAARHGLILAITQALAREGVQYSEPQVTAAAAAARRQEPLARASSQE